MSFYTPNYQRVVEGRAADGCKTREGLVESLDRHNLAHDVRAVESFGGFIPAVRHKPRFILEMLNEHLRSKYICWVDADAVVQIFPGLLYDIRADFAAHWRDGIELLSGTMLWRNSPKVRTFIGHWIGECEKNAQPGLPFPEQQILQSMLPRSGLAVYDLPSEYCKIFDLVEMNDRARCVLPVIEHFQASRELRHAPEEAPCVAT